jgi:hypothetical protein
MTWATTAQPPEDPAIATPSASAKPAVIEARIEWAGSLRASQDRAARRRESLREQQAIQLWLRHLASRKAAER